MPNPIIRIHDLVTDEVIDRPMNDAEMKQAEAEKAAYAVLKAEREAKASEKAAIADRLGLTPDELALLLA